MSAIKETPTSKMNIFTISVPQGTETNFLRAMSRNMGWKTKVTRPKKEKKKDPTLMTKEEFYAKIESAKEQVRNGEVSPTFLSPKEMFEYIESLAENEI